LPLYNRGLNNSQKVDDLIESIWEFLSDSKKEVAFLASVVNKPVALREFKSRDYEQFLSRNTNEQKTTIKNLRKELSLYMCDCLFDWLLQRLEFLGNPNEWDYSDGFIIGDESSVNNFMYKSQAATQSGLCKFTNLPKIVNNIWFGASLHNPCLQIADWIAYSVRTWAEKRQGANLRLKMILPHFRGFPNNVLGWGIVPIPRSNSFPALPT